MYDMSNSTDLFISPILTNNNAVNFVSNVNTNSQTEQIDAFEKIFDDVNEQFAKEIEDITKSTDKNEEDKYNMNGDTGENFLSLMGNFGPPLGLVIEGFDYSLI